MYGLFVIMLAALPRGLDAAMVFEFSSELHRPSSSWTVYDITTGAGVSGTRNPPTKQKSIFGSRKADYLERSKNELIAQRMQIIRFFELGTNEANVLRIG